jgi:uncharacterized protein (TIRG00374 family)
MMNRRRIVFNIVFLVIVFSITVYFILHGQDISDLMQNIRDTDGRYWIISVLCVIAFISSESIILYYMMNTICQKVSFRHCLLYSFTGFFFSCITPSATGGQPAQIYLMKKDKIPISIATLILMIVTITYKMVLIALGLVVLIIRPEKIMEYLNPALGLCYLGLAINIVFVGFMLLLVFHPTMAQNQLTAIVRFLGKLHLIRRTDHYLHKIDSAMKQYKDIASYFRSNKGVIWNVFVISGIQRILLFLVTYLTYRSFGLRDAGPISIVILQGMIAVAVDMLPLPGGMGISETLFLSIFTPVFGSVTLPAMIISRGISYYTQLIISAIFTIAAFLFIGRKAREEKGK